MALRGSGFDSQHVVGGSANPVFSLGLCGHWASTRCTGINLGKTLIYEKSETKNRQTKKNL